MCERGGGGGGREGGGEEEREKKREREKEGGVEGVVAVLSIWDAGAISMNKYIHVHIEIKQKH